MPKIAALTFFLFALFVAGCASPTLPHEGFSEVDDPEVYTREVYSRPKASEKKDVFGAQEEKPKWSILTAFDDMGADAVPKDEDADEAQEANLLQVGQEDDDLLLLLEVHDHIDAMKKKGATEADCKDLAKSSCKVVEDEVKTDIRTMHALKDGKECLTFGMKQVTTAKHELIRVTHAHKTAKVSLTVSQSVKVNLGVHTFKSLEVGTCAIFHGKKDCTAPVVKFKMTMYKRYLKSKAIEERMRKIEIMWRSRVTQATRDLKLATTAHERQVTHCLCDDKSRRDKIWKIIGDRKRRATQETAHKKCKVMECVVSNTPTSSSRCKSRLPKVEKKTLIKQAESVRKCGASYSSSSTTHTLTHSKSTTHTVKHTSFSKSVSHFKRHIAVPHKIRHGKFVKNRV